MATMTVREATSDDLDAVAELADRFYREEGFDTPTHELHDHAARLIVSPAALVLIGLVDNKPAGIAISTTSYGLEHGLIAELEDLYVLPGARRSGLARQLIEQSRSWAAGEGCSELEVVVDPDGEARHGLIGFYAKLGFADFGRRLLSQLLLPAKG
jgi:aminoglycoside 6'-N-acetyltransferase I